MISSRKAFSSKIFSSTPKTPNSKITLRQGSQLKQTKQQSAEEKTQNPKKASSFLLFFKL